MSELEKKIEKRICKLAEKELGAKCVKLAIVNERGFPDRTLLIPGGRILFLEVKKPGGKTSPQQDEWLRTLRQLGFAADVVDNLEDAETAIWNAAHSLKLANEINETN